MNEDPCDSGKHPRIRSNKRHCLRCGYDWYVKCDEPKRCPSCSSYLWNTVPDDYTCLRCGHTWRRRGDRIPTICPKCKSEKWNISKKGKNQSRTEAYEGNSEVMSRYDSGMGCVKIAMETRLSIAEVLKAVRECVGSDSHIRM